MVAQKYSIILVLSYLIGSSIASNSYSNEQSAESTNAKRSLVANVPAKEVSVPSLAVAPSQQYYQSKAPTRYSNSIPAAAIRNVETVAVTKTITPVVTKTTTYKTHSEPALSIGHVQGYSNSAVGQPKIAPVQYVTQYTSYGNPTVGANGPVIYTGPAVYVGGGYGGGNQVLALAAPAGSSHGHRYSGQVLLAAAPVRSSYGGRLNSNYGGPLVSYASPGVSYGPSKVQVASAPLKLVSSYGQPQSHIHNTYQVPQQQRLVSSYGIPKGQPLGAYSMNYLNFMRPPRLEPAASFHQPQYYYAPMRMQQQQQRQPVRTVVETYAAPSITLTRRVPVAKQ